MEHIGLILCGCAGGIGLMLFLLVLFLIHFAMSKGSAWS
jgi:hypothetical protein